MFLNYLSDLCTFVLFIGFKYDTLILLEIKIRTYVTYTVKIEFYSSNIPITGSSSKCEANEVPKEKKLCFLSLLKRFCWVRVV